MGYTLTTAESIIMEWTKAVSEAVSYIESHITDDIAMYEVADKEAFSVLCTSKEFGYENAKQEIPCTGEHYASGKGKYVCGMFGINIDPNMGNKKFEYLIADLYNLSVDIPDGFAVKTIPALTWAVFPCKGALPHALQV